MTSHDWGEIITDWHYQKSTRVTITEKSLGSLKIGKDKLAKPN